MNNPQNVTYFEARKWASFRIKDAGDVDMYDVDFLLEQLFDLSAADLLIHYQARMPNERWQVFQDAIHQLLKGIPPQYIAGKADFYGLSLKVTPAVLIPRVETEELVDWILNDNPDANLKVLDIGTGSGTIAIALKHFRPHWQIVASDISSAAIEVARQNATANQTRIQFALSDVFEDIHDSFDIIVSNPPYIAKDEQPYMDRRVIAHEPDLALYAENQGLAIYKQIAAGTSSHLTSSGRLYLEIGFHQEAAVTTIFKAAMPTAHVIAKHDASGHQRMIQVKKWRLYNMETLILKKQQLDQAADFIRQGELVAFPTETVYGLGANATNEVAVKKVYAAKGRPSDNPLIVTVSDVAMVAQYAQPFSADAKALMAKFWPGSLTMIFKLKPNALSKSVTGGLDTAAFRFPKNQTTLDLISKAGVPIVGPSANTSGKPSPTTAQHVYHDLNGKIAAIVDDGPTTVGVESTILDMSVATPSILRPGAVTKEAIEAVIHRPVIDELHHVGAKQTPKAPGMKYKHYAPNAQVYIVDPDDDWHAVANWIKQHPQPVGVMAFDDVIKTINWPDNVNVISLGKDAKTAAHDLFAELRDFDNHPVYKIIFTQGIDPKGIGEAYMNRLNKSAGQMHFKQL